MDLIVAMSVASRAGLFIQRTMSKAEGQDTLWGFKLVDTPYEPTWCKDPGEALADLVIRVLKDRRDRQRRHLREVKAVHPHGSLTQTLNNAVRDTGQLLYDLEVL